jgi:ABC-type lipoprotein release transport system permease subunit
MVSAFQGAVRPDAVAFVGLPALLFAVALCAAWLPARAVLAIDPSRLLRSS